MKRSTAITRGIAAIMAFLLFVTVSGSNLMFNYAGIINSALNISTTKIVDTGEGTVADTVYYDNPYGADVTNQQSTLELELAVAAENILQAEEGAVLLKNDNGALPFAEGTQITVFGNSSVNSQRTADSTAFDAIPAVSFISAMQTALGEDNVNTVLADNVYSQLGTTSNLEVIEAPVSDVIAYENTWQDAYNDAAVVVLSRIGGESNDDVMVTEEGNHYLGLQNNERALMEYLQSQKAAGVFGSIVVVINSDQMMELDWLDDYDVDACLLAGLPGAVGFTGTANVMMGTVSPSGHLVDTYVSNSLSAPAVTYAASNTQQWSNADWVIENCADNNNNGDSITAYIIYAEGIYVGYKYYETRYEDVVMGAGGADSAVGSSTGDAWNYTDEVVFPFGYGLSYTTFEQELQSVTYDEAEDVYQVEVLVTNTGDVSGMSVVQVYAQTPYGDYEKENLVEKAAIQFVGMEKTETLEPGTSVTVTVPVERYMLASYDSNGAEGYILSAGDYYLSIGDNAHDALNNVLAAKGYTTADGMDYDGEAAKTYTWNQAELDVDSYRLSRYTGEEVTNQFDYADLNYYGIEFTYLSRSDWEGTYPQTAVSVAATEEMVTDLSSDWYEQPEDAPAVSDFTQGVDNGLTFSDMRLVEWEDEETWNAFLDQLTVEDMANLLLDEQSNPAIEHVGLPSYGRDDDNYGVQRSVFTSVGGNAMRWVTEGMTARTWNKERFAARGELLGIEASYCGVNELWYGGGNLHRTPFGGRNAQYYSEDGNYGYIVGAYEAEAMQAVGVTYCIKHFVLNDQETSRGGVSTFSNEQAIREIYLRAFEGALCEGGALGVMTGFNRVGVVYCATNVSLLTNVLRGEWGYQGHVTTDGYTASALMQTHAAEELVAGVDYHCLDSSDNGAAILAMVEEGDGLILQYLRQATKRNVYAMSRTVAQNGLDSSSTIVTVVPWWEAVLLVLTALFAVGFVGFTAATAVLTAREKTAVKEGKQHGA